MASDNTAAQDFHRMQLVQSISSLAHQLRECATHAEHYIHALGYNVAPYVPIAPPNGQFAAMPMMPVMPMAQDEQGKKRKSRGDDPEGKRQKKPKDPNAPKRPASSYLLFQNDVRQELKAKNPNMRNNELLSAIAKMWAEMPQEQKDAYEARNRAAKDEWLAQKAIYEGKLGAAAAVAGAAAPAVVAAPLKPVVAPPAAATPSSDASSGEDEDSSSDTSSEDDVPPPKKSKRDSAKDESSPKKEKKHKKSKA